MKLPIHRASLIITHNDHKDYSEPLAKWLEENDNLDSFESADHMQRAISTNECWLMQWYPLTPVGSYTCCAPTLPELIAFALEIERQYCANTPMLAEIQSDHRHGDDNVAMIERERERCAAIADKERNHCGDCYYCQINHAAVIAAQIRGELGSGDAHEYSCKQAQLQEERERCAKIAEGMTCVYSGPALRVEGFDLAKASIAQRIRAGEDRGCDPPQTEKYSNRSKLGS